MPHVAAIVALLLLLGIALLSGLYAARMGERTTYLPLLTKADTPPASVTASVTLTASATASPTASPTAVPATPTTSNTPSPSATLTATATPTASATAIPTPLLRDVSETHLPQAVRGGRTMEARAGDVDGDGDLDLILAKEFGINVLLLNDGLGHFADATATHMPQVIHDSEDIALADLDGDEDLDVVIVSEDDQVSVYYLNDGTGHFSAAPQPLPMTATTNAVVAGDIDGDDDLDLIFGVNGQDATLVNDGNGVFSNETAARLPMRLDITQDVALGDVDGDEDLDLLVGNEDNNRLLLNNGLGVFADAPERLPLRATVEETRNADFGDADGDGDLDIFFANVVLFAPGSDPQDRLLLNDGQGFFSDATATNLPLDPTGTMDGDFVDIDRDGDRDLLTAHFPSQPYRALLNDGLGFFRDGTAVVYPAGIRGAGVEIEAADFDGDKRPDLYLAAYNEPDQLLLSGPATRQ